MCLEGPRTKEGWKGWLMAEPDGDLERLGSSQEVDDGCDGEIEVVGRRGASPG